MNVVLYLPFFKCTRIPNVVQTNQLCYNINKVFSTAISQFYQKIISSYTALSTNAPETHNMLHIRTDLIYKKNKETNKKTNEKHGALTVVMLDYIKWSGFKPCQGRSIVFLGKVVNSHTASLHPGIQNDAGCNPAMDQLQEGMEILPVS